MMYGVHIGHISKKHQKHAENWLSVGVQKGVLETASAANLACAALTSADVKDSAIMTMMTMHNY